MISTEPPIISRAPPSCPRSTGFLGQAAFHLTTLGRVQQQAGDPQLAAQTLTRAMAAAEQDGDLRMTATARVNLARVYRQADRPAAALPLLEQADRWYVQAGGGDGALLTRVLLASIRARSASAEDRSALDAILVQARTVQDTEVEILALDVIARMSAQESAVDQAQRTLDVADGRARDHPAAVDEIDRIDAHHARRIMSGAPTGHPIIG